MVVIKSGAMISLLVMLPNIIWMLMPKNGTGNQASVPVLWSTTENMGRVAVIAIPFFYDLNIKGSVGIITTTAAALALAVYYIAWARYFIWGRNRALFRAAIFGIPLPLAVAPVTFFVLSSVLLGSWAMLVASLVFGVAHIWVSAISL